MIEEDEKEEFLTLEQHEDDNDYKSNRREIEQQTLSLRWLAHA